MKLNKIEYSKRAQESSKLFDYGSKILDSRYMIVGVRC